MKNLLLARIIFLILVLCFSSASLARSRVADSQVRLIGNQPCFGVVDQNESVDGPRVVLGLIVYDTRLRPPKKIWSLRASTKAPAQFSPDQCLIYGDVPRGMTASGTAPTLETGVVYRVYINARSQNQRSPTRGYTRSFCLKGNSDKQMEIKEIRWDNTNKRWRYDVCEETPAALSGGAQLNMQKSAQ